MTRTWFGNLKSKWPVVPLREVAHLGTGHTPSRDKEEYWEDCNIPWVTVEDIRKHGLYNLEPLLETSQHISQLGLENSAAVLHPEGTVMLSRTASIGFSCLTGKEMATTQAFVTWTPKNRTLNPRFLHAALKAMHQQYEYLAYGATHLTIYFPDIKTLRVPLPPAQEQECIANFLDRETAKIDDLIAEQLRLIELLQEKRQAVISHAVTKGLNTNAPMKDSGVEWLGEVPEHWTVSPLKHFGKITTGFAFKSDEFQDEGVPLLRISDIQGDGTIDLKYAKHLRESELLNHPSETMKQGDIAMAMTGGTIGKAGIYASDEPALLNQRVCVFRAKSGCTQAFLWLITSSRFYQEHIRLASFGGAQPNISEGDLLACICPIPPLAEQEEISACINSQFARLGELQCKAESTVELLDERRSSLISAAVTGQIDVRGLAQEGEP